MSCLLKFLKATRLNMKIEANLRTICISLFMINIVFWLGIFVYFSFVRFAAKEEYLIMKILLLGEPLIFGIGLIGYLKKYKLVYLFTLLFLLGNAILSMTDEVGMYDWISLVLSVSLLVVLFVQRKEMLNKSGQ